MGFVLFMVILAMVALGGIIVGFKNVFGFLVTGVAAVLMVIVFLFNVFTVIDSGNFAVAKVLGTIQPGYYPGTGLQTVNPLAELTVISSKRTTFEIDGSAISSDGNPLTVSVNFPYMPNPVLAWKVLSKVGPDYQTQLIQRAAATAVRDGINAHTWLEANGMKPESDDGSTKTGLNANSDGRRQVEASILTAWKRTVTAQLVDAGFTQTEAQEAFEFSDVQLLHASPQQAILDAISLKVAATQELERQRIITQTAGEIAKRRTQEGDGYANLLKALPLNGQTVSPGQIADILHGIADKERADATLVGVENGKVGQIILSGVPVATTSK